MRLVLSGGTGFLGGLLRRALSEEGHQVVLLVRRPPSHAEEIFWNYGERKIEREKLEGMDVFIHLSGENIGRGRWTRKKKERIYSSRVESTRFLCEVLATLSSPPKTLLTASAVGIYGNRSEEVLTEASAPGAGFLARLACDWESATQPAREKGIRVVPLRFGVVLSQEGGALPLLIKTYRWFLGGRLGSGAQWISWVSDEDVTGVVKFLLEKEEIRGPVNLVAREPVRQRELSHLLTKITKRPALMSFPAPILRLLLGEMATEMLLSSQRVYPEMLLKAGYRFRWAQLPPFLEKMTGF